ncbi:MAG: hypothetical protein QXS19_05800 [Candidatus Methanomethylicia archaeon]
MRPRVRIIGRRNNRVYVFSYNEQLNKLVYVYASDITSDNFVFEFDPIGGTLGRGCKLSLIRVVESDYSDAPILEEMFVYTYPDWIGELGATSSIGLKDLVDSTKWSNVRGECMIIDIEKSQKFIITFTFTTTRYFYPAIEREAKQLVVLIGREKYEAGKWNKLEPPLIEIFYWDGSRKIQVIEPDQMTYAIITFKISFNDENELHKYLVSLTNSHPTQSVILNNTSLTISEKNKLLSMLASEILTTLFSHKVLRVTCDQSNLYVTVELNFGDINWETIFGIIGIVAGVVLICTGVGAIAGVGILSGLGVTGAIASIMIGIGVTGAGAYLLYKAGQKVSPPPPPSPPAWIREELDSVFKDLLVKVSSDFSGLRQFVEELYSKGKISVDVRDLFIKKINEIEERVKSLIEDVHFKSVEIAEESYKKGYEDGYNRHKEEVKDKFLTYGLLGGAGGFALGVLIGRR